ncbi:MAG: ParB/RepB/Spo0J family partition protein [Acidobacteria bacterium]|nr:ParB/RepB/Spo0J family partition protein [Acidobacteriota bacterium]
MPEKRRGLGRGLGALIPSGPVEERAPQAVNHDEDDAYDDDFVPTPPTSRPVDLFFPDAKKRRSSRSPVSRETERVAEMPKDAASSAEPEDSGVAGSSPKTGGATKAAAAKSASAKVSPVRPGSARANSARPAAGGNTAASPKSFDADAEAPVSRETSQEVTFIDAGLVEVPGATFAEIPVNSIHPNRKQPRSVFDEDEMAELVHSVRTIGVLQPIVVRRSTESGGEPYELVMGERRWRASQKAGLETVPAIIRDTADDDLLRDALLENLHRSQLNPLEEAAAYQQLLEDFGTTHEQLADRIGRSRPQVSNTLRLLRLPALVQARVAAGVLSAGHARALLSLPDAAAMERIAQRIVQEGMSVRSTEEAVAMYQEPQPGAKTPTRANARHERLDFLADSLADKLDTNVKITLGARKGKVSIEFASVEDLNRIMDVLAPGGNN